MPGGKGCLLPCFGGAQPSVRAPASRLRQASNSLWAGAASTAWAGLTWSKHEGAAGRLLPGRSETRTTEGDSQRANVQQIAPEPGSLKDQ